MSEFVRIPLNDPPVAYALVDTDDAERIGVHRWGMSGGYACRHMAIDGERRTVWMHREVLEAEDPDLIVDHVNRNAVDNRRSNLRVCTQAQNNQNKGPSEFKGGSVFRGVSRAGNRWQAKAAGKNIGCFGREIDAARAAEAYRREHMPFAEPDPRLADAEAAGDWREAA